MAFQLPLIKDETTLPTKRHYVSYSEISDWMECRFRHKLKYVKKIRIKDSSIHTVFGKTIHDAIETFLMTKKMPKAEDIRKEFYKKLTTIEDEEELTKALELAKDFANEIPEMVNQIPAWMDETFPNWELVSAEYNLFEPIMNQLNIRFKGFLDAIIRVPKKPTKKLIKQCEKERIPVPVQYTYYVLDWKTTSWGWKAERKRDFSKQMQIILYKHFFCKFMKLDLKNVKCGFVLIKRTPSKSGNRIELVSISAGPKAIDKALKTVHNMINQVRKDFVYKNRKYCEPFCPYKGTTYCP